MVVKHNLISFSLLPQLTQPILPVLFQPPLLFVSKLCEKDSANMCEQTKQVPISHGLSGIITVLNNLKIIEMTTQIKEGVLYISQNPNIIFSDTLWF